MKQTKTLATCPTSTALSSNSLIPSINDSGG